MAQRYFGTDGIRGQVNTGHMTVGTVYKLARAASKVFCSHPNASRSVLIGKDTRQSCDMFEAALIAGLNSVGVKCFIIGVAPTPAVALLTTVVKTDFGIMISASHNPYTDNGIKLFDATGHKLEEKLESKIEGLMDDISQIALSNSDQIGTVERSNTLLQVYKSALLNSVPQNISLDKLKIVLDCAHGAAFQIAPAILKSLNASLVIIGAEPDGLNINNKIGSTHTEKLKQTVLQHKADIGIALDGDADRCILVDETGQEIDGDQLIALIATQWRAESKLSQAGVVTTIMSNLGLENYLKSLGLTLQRTQVGDRHVVQKMRSDGYNIGGEQSGHIVLSDISTTGDGLLAALQVLVAMINTQKPLSILGNVFTPVPQNLINVRYAKDSEPLENDEVKAVIRRVEEQLGETGRLVIRKSGTEPLIRIMTESIDATLMKEAGEEIAATVRQVSQLSKNGS